MAKPVVDFEMNEPVEVSLHWPDGKIVSSRFGERVMYSLDQPAGHVMFLDLAVAQQINMLEPGLNPFVLCKRGKSKFDVWKPDGSPAETVLEAQLRESRLQVVAARTRASVSAPALAETPTPSRHSTPPANANNNGNGSTNGSGKPPAAPAKPPIAAGWAQFLLSTTNDLVDVYAAALHYASERHGNAIKPEDVKSLLTTAYIAQTKGQAPHVS
jgi:hypothetical protein